jgi:hypothetical protein
MGKSKKQALFILSLKWKNPMKAKEMQGEGFLAGDASFPSA